jgi:hypothetical protein
MSVLLIRFLLIRFFDFTGGKAVAEPPENKIKELEQLYIE